MFQKSTHGTLIYWGITDPFHSEMKKIPFYSGSLLATKSSTLKTIYILYNNLAQLRSVTAQQFNTNEVLWLSSIYSHVSMQLVPCYLWENSFPKVWCVFIMLYEYKYAHCCCLRAGDNESLAPGGALVTLNLPVLVHFIWCPFYL